MSDLNKTKDELLSELDLAKAGYDWAKVQELEKAIKILDEKGEEHKVEMTEAREKVNEEETMKMEELINLLKDKPENAEKNAEKIVNQAKSRLKETIDRYVTKIKELKNTTGSEKEQLTKDLETARAELKAEKNKYEAAKNYFLGTTNYDFQKFTKEDIGKFSTQFIRYSTREGKLFNAPKISKMKTLRKNRTIKTLIKKFNNIGTNEKDGVRFIMGFEKSRFLRYSGIKVNSAMDKAWWAMGLKMDPQQFHDMFNAGRKNIFAILDAKTGDEPTVPEQKIIDALKNRINYYGYTYARARATAWTNPFINAEKNASEGTRIIQMEPPSNTANVA